MVDRIKELMLAKELTATKFAETIGVQRSAVSHVLSGRNNPSLDFILKLKQAFPLLNLDYILLGEGALLEEVSTDAPIREVSKTDKRAELFQGEIGFEMSDENSERHASSAKESKELVFSAEKEDMVRENGLLQDNEKTDVATAKRGNDKPKQIILVYEDDTYRLIRPR